MYYIISKENRVISKINYRPSLEDLSSRAEFYIESDVNIDLQDAVYVKGKLQKRKVVIISKFIIDIEGEDRDGDGSKELIAGSDDIINVSIMIQNDKGIIDYNRKDSFYLSIVGDIDIILDDMNRKNLIGKKATLVEGMFSFKIKARNTLGVVYISVESIDGTVTKNSEKVEIIL